MKLKVNNKLLLAIKVVFFLTLLYFPLFIHLEKLPMRIWDEARLAVNACEMNLNHNYIVTYFDGKPDMWNTKPPLMIWIQTLMIKIFGVRELAIRLPSAVAALFTALLLMAFSLKYVKSYWFGFISSFILITSFGYVHHHGTRTGDYDSLLTLLTTTYCLSYFMFLESNKIKYLHLFFIAATLAVLTKSIQGTLFLPSLAIYTFAIQGKFKKLIVNKWLYINSVLFVLIIGGYYLLREKYNPGYIQAVTENELGGRFLKSQTATQTDFFYYYHNLINERFKSWYLLIPISIIAALTLKNKIYKRIVIFTGLNILSYWLIISNAQTKLEWYDLPLYPFLALLSSITIYCIFEFLRSNSIIKNKIAIQVLPLIFLSIVFFLPYREIIYKTYTPSENEKDYYSMSYFVRGMIKDPAPFHHYNISFDNPDKAHLMFYIYMMRDKGKHIEIKDCRYLNPGDEIIAIQSHEKEFIEKFYNYELLETFGQVKAYKILNHL
ncbi:MAG TPA: glycosyltransferase family 39 protein [Bacteroidia bacterium]|nr:glycosyltransferase family 39 protein [Bacteroidia bacterium]